MELRLPSPALVVLVGPSGAGKSVWAAAQFRPDQVVSTDGLRALVGEGEHDQRAGTDAFDVLGLVLERRLKRKLLTVVDSLGLDPAKRAEWRALATKYGVPCHAVLFDTPAKDCRARNKARDYAVPSKVLTAQLAGFDTARAAIDDEGFDGVHAPGDVRLVPAAHAGALAFADKQREDPMTLTFGLQIPNFTWPGGPGEMRETLKGIAQAAEAAGFESLWVMDHFIQIPMAGREWDDMLDSYTALAFLAGVTERVQLGAMVTGVTYRNVAHLGKIVATLDVLSGGRAICGIGAAWFEREHVAYGWEFPSVRDRMDLLEDALQLLPLMWGKGSPSFDGKVLHVPEALCYPRPLQEHVPILIGGSGEKRTLKLVAQYADACNLFGDAASVRHKIEVLHRHCADAQRDPSDITVTHLSGAGVGADREGRVLTVEDHVGRYRELAEAGVQTAIVNVPGLEGPADIEALAPLVAAFSGA
ncbi:MAG TPA: TIGR03560 family F420-dependent LLM class oxidoreductase [Acidimicrobiales bacterium]|nr:TIGR03560 family F420-dependent LLM class oxidoreductase [Acidimicrobiales bacterium]